MKAFRSPSSRSSLPRLLIVTQTVDSDDPVLGFFVRWLEEFSKSFSSIEVICLKEGKHRLPGNVRVHSLGKEKGPPRYARRLRYALRFKMLSWRLRKDYDAVFVHMNEEYVLIAGLLWRLLGKRIVLWRNFRTGSWMTPLACRLSHSVCYTSPDSYTSRFPHAVQMPIGIDTGVFKPADVPAPRGTLLFFGRLDEIKRPDLFLATLKKLAERGVAYEARVYGDPTAGNEAYATELKRRFADLTHVSFHPGTTNADAPAVYQAHDIYVNLTPSGSFDKTIGEAMAAGCIVVCANEAVRGAVPDSFIVSLTEGSVMRGLEAALALDASERAALSAANREYVEKQHSLRLLAERLSAIFDPAEVRPSRLIWLPTGGHMGDAVMITSLFAEIIRREPEVRISYMVRRNASLIAELASAYRQIKVISVQDSPLGALIAVLPLFRHRTAVIAPPPWGARPRVLKVLSFLFKLRGDRVVAFDDGGAKRFYSEVLSHDKGVRYIDNLRRAAWLAGLPTDPIGTPPSMQFRSSLPVDFPFAARSYLLIHPFPHMSTAKTLPLRRWIALAKELRQRYPAYGIVITGAEVDRTQAEAVTAAAGEGAYLAIDRSIGELAGLIGGAKLYIGVDTGPTHIAGVLHAPSVVLAQQKEPMWLPTYNPNATLLWAKEYCTCGIPGKPCGIIEDGNTYRRCVYDLSDETILGAIAAKLAV